MNKIKSTYRKYSNYKLIQGLKRIYTFIKYNCISDKLFIKLTFKLSHGYSVNLKKPRSLNEKIQWLKLYDRTPLHTKCADKYKVREYVKEKIGEEYLVSLHFFTKNPKDITKKNLPNTPCIIKTNHNSSGGIIIRSKDNQNWKEYQKWLKKQLKENYYRKSKEWQYKNIDRGIIVEKLLITKTGLLPFDYKVHCFNGRPEMIQVDLHRGKPYYSRNWYDVEWNILPFGWYLEKEGRIMGGNGEIVDRPENLEKLLDLSSKLASDFKYVRIDWYNVDGELFFGEITFHHDSGLRPITPIEWDFKLGDKLDLRM